MNCAIGECDLGDGAVGGVELNLKQAMPFRRVMLLVASCCTFVLCWAPSGPVCSQWLMLRNKEHRSQQPVQQAVNLRVAISVQYHARWQHSNAALQNILK